ncbi:hypothetical protein [Alkalicoccobacillus plakortidis]|uniref:DUF4190 domain-containing protein n=1 Tax=Alkalicoccobacillus plakortidis TaxID=444060 RepID=A0ABT0XJP5_9BACI|nr:hypothetical protein [Alkalicoccobacillus plakortidis]MCM2676104.1 hypothetical protein [Alkalicoccobacillus plakortidis]
MTETTTQQNSAIGALVVAIIGFFAPFIGIILAIIALVMISKVTSQEQRGLIVATKVISWITLAGYIIFLLLIIARIVV